MFLMFNFDIMAGEYVGLTGARLDGAEMLACGLATHFVPLEVHPILIFKNYFKIYKYLCGNYDYKN